MSNCRRRNLSRERKQNLSKSILVVEDETAIREMVVDALERSGYTALEARHALDAYDVLAATIPDLVLLDWMLPGTSGVDLARRLRRNERTRDIPIIMLTAKSEEEDRVAGFEVGVDDYVSKPFSMRELLARIKAMLRRMEPARRDQPLEAVGLKLTPLTHRVSADGNMLKLGPTEFRLLQFFMSHREQVFSRAQLLDGVWGTNAVVEERTVDVHVRRVRRHLARYGYDVFIQTVHGAGYRFSTGGADS